MYYFMAMKAKVMNPTALFSRKFNYLSKKQGASLTKFWNYHTKHVTFSPLFIFFFFFFLLSQSISFFLVTYVILKDKAKAT